MPTLTLRFDTIVDDAARRQIEGLAGATATTMWRACPQFERTYALVALDERAALHLRAELQAKATVFPAPIIALAVLPQNAEALPLLAAALGGPGRPAGVYAASIVGDAFVVEWNPDRTLPRVVVGLIDLELRRFACGRRLELLAPLSPEVAAQIARDGLRTPQIGVDRELETLLDRAGLG